MNAPTVREELISMLINELSDGEVASLLSIAKSIRSPELPQDYDEENDPLVGFISGPTDLAERTEEILESEFGLRKSQDEA